MGQVGVDDASGHPDSNGKNITSYKIAISILFGFLGLSLTFIPSIFLSRHISPLS